MSYNGWTNYETWAVKLWIDSEEGSWRYWDGEARAAVSVGRLADQLKDKINEANPLDYLPASMFTDLLRSALDSVNWREIAEALMEPHEEEDEEETA